MTIRVVVVDDETYLAEAVGTALERAGMDVAVAFSGSEALMLIDDLRPDVVVLDRDLPGVHGDEVCTVIVDTHPATRVIMLTASGTLDDRLSGFDLGADDYLPKPFALEELLARVGSLLRRSRSESRKVAEEPSTTLQFEDLVMDTSTRDVTRAGRPISLTRTEFALLHLLMQNPRHVLARQTILEEVWGYDFPTSGNALEVYIGYLRRKTEAGGESRLIHTVRGVGYVLRETAP